MRAAVIHIWVPAEFEALGIRLIAGDTELLLGVSAIGKLNSEGSFRRRNFQYGQGEWKAMVRNNKSLRVSHIAPTARGHTKLEEYVAKMGNFGIGVLAFPTDSDGGFEVQKLQNQNKKATEIK